MKAPCSEQCVLPYAGAFLTGVVLISELLGAATDDVVVAYNLAARLPRWTVGDS